MATIGVNISAELLVASTNTCPPSDGHHLAAMILRTTVSGGLRIRPAAPTLGTSNSKAAIIPAAAAPSPRHQKVANAHSCVPGRQTYATAPESRRRSVTPFDDDGRVPWTELSAAGKTARAVQQTFNFGLVVGGLVLTVCNCHT